MEKFVEACRGLTRPVVTLLLVGVLARLVWHAKMPALPVEVGIALVSSFTTAVAVVVAFWFASRNNRPA